MSKITLEEYIDPFKPGHLAVRAEHYARYVWAIKRLKKHIKPNGVVYDVGCGGGYGTGMLQKAGFEAIGLDINESYLSSARNDYPGPRYIQLDLENERLAEIAAKHSLAKPDAIIIFETLEHISNPNVVLEDAYTLLSSGGRIIASVPNMKFVEGDVGLSKNPYHKQMFSRRQLSKMMKQEHFAISRVRGQSLTNFLYHNVRWIYSLLDSYIAGSFERFKKVALFVAWPRHRLMKWSYSVIVEGVKE